MKTERPPHPFVKTFHKKRFFLNDGFPNTNIRSLIRMYSYIRIFSDTNIRLYHIFVSSFWYNYIRIFVRMIFLTQTYSDICSYRFLDIDIFEYLFVSKFHIRHTLDLKILECQVFFAIFPAQHSPFLQKKVSVSFWHCYGTF